MNVFFVSNSTCYYFTDELYGLLTAAGDDDVNLSLVYYSGCSVQRHHLWWKEKKSAYQLRVLDRNGLTVFPDTSLADALATQSWDFISFDNNARSFSSGDTATSLAQAEPWFGELFSEISRKGMVLTGGGSLLHGLDRLIEHVTGVPARLARKPISSAVLGAGKLLPYLDKMPEGLVSLPAKMR